MMTTNITSAEPKRAHRSIRELLLPLVRIASESQVLHGDSPGFWRCGDELFFLPRFTFQRTAVSKSRIKVAIFAGINGDELGAMLGLTDFVRALEAHPAIGREYQLWLYPLCNPSGYVDGTRRSRSGKHLEREMWNNSPAPEVKLIEKDIREQNFDGIISLRGNATISDAHAYVWGGALPTHLLTPTLIAAEQTLAHSQQPAGLNVMQPMNRVHRDCSFRAPPEQREAPFEMVLEVPRHMRLRQQAQKFVLLLHAILAAYRRVTVECGHRSFLNKAA
jgi:protein MpaA